MRMSVCIVTTSDVAIAAHDAGYPPRFCKALFFRGQKLQSRRALKNAQKSTSETTSISMLQRPRVPQLAG